MNLKTAIVFSSLITFSAIILFLPFIGKVNLFDWDEINFAESAREMIFSGDYSLVTINYTQFAEKPPLFIWMQVVSMKIFGINEFAARLPNAICGIITMITLYFTGRKLMGNNFGLMWSFVHVTGVLPLLYFKSGIMDPWYNYFTFIAIIFLYFYQSEKYKSTRYLVYSALFLGLAILIKGPAALLIYLITVIVFFLFSKNKPKINFSRTALFLMVLIITGGSWYIYQILKGNFTVVEKFINYNFRLFSTEDSGHGGNIFYHFYILFFLVFPTSLFAIPTFFQRIKKDFLQLYSFKLLMIILFIVVLVVFSIVRTKIVHYSSLAYFPLSFLATLAINENLRKMRSLKRWQYAMLLIIGILYAASFFIFLAFPLIKNYVIQSNWIDDSFFISCLNANVYFKNYELILTAILPVTTIISLYWFKINKRRYAWIMLIISYIAYNYFVIVHTAPKVEQYSQHALIEFCKEKPGIENLVNTRGFYSYAPLFYCRVPNNKSSWPLSIIDEKNTKRRIYVIMKINKAFDILKNEPDLKLLYYKNGYVFTEKIRTNP